VYTVGVQEDDTTALTFGTGEHGARLPTGVANVRAKYRSGIGKPGNVKAESITLLASRPLGVREVINPLRASGGADAEDRDHVRANAPLAVAALDRLIGVRDYADFARTFAGIGHADAIRLSDGARDVIHVTVAGIDDVPIDDTSDLLTSLADALQHFGDPTVFVQVKPRELLALVVIANVIIDADYLWDDVAARARAALVAAFSFAKRGLGQPAYLSEAIAALQSVAGVVAVDVDVFDAISEQELTDADALTKKLDQLKGNDPERPQPQTVVSAARARRDEPSAINRAGPVRPILPAQLAFIVPEVADTVILNRR
jgi:predicted phage baseplate assembly protein